MGANDDAAYRRSVRNTAALLGLVVVVVVAGLVLPAYFVSPPQPPKSVSVYNPNGLTLSMSINATQASSQGGISVELWINGTSTVENITSQDGWPVSPGMLWRNPCFLGWPIGIGVMKGSYDLYNYTSAALLPLGQTPTSCKAEPGSPTSFLVQPRGSESIASINGSLEEWRLRTTATLQVSSLAPGQGVGGTFTVVGVDEWGDIAFLYFVVPVQTS